MPTIIATGTSLAGLKADIQAGRHRFVADEPVALGGLDRGPAPFDYLLAALGACTVMTLRLYASRKGWPLDAVDVKLHHAVRASSAQRDVFSREIHLIGELSTEQRARLLEIAERCPVGRTLAAGVDIQSTLAADAPIGEAGA